MCRTSRMTRYHALEARVLTGEVSDEAARAAGTKVVRHVPCLGPNVEAGVCAPRRQEMVHPRDDGEEP